jgi:hypothetical protein
MTDLERLRAEMQTAWGAWDAALDAAIVADIAKGLTAAQRDALLALPALRDADPSRWVSAITHGNSWRKLTKDRPVFESMIEAGLVEIKHSSAETLWRATKPLGLAVRDHLSSANPPPAPAA